MATIRRIAASGIVVLIALFAAPAWATAATGGPGAPDVPPVNIGGTPAGSTVLCTQQVGPGGGTVGCSGVTVTVGTTASGVQVVLTSATGPACSVTPGIGVSFFDPTSGQSFTGPFGSPVSVSYANASVTAGETVLVYNAATASWTAAPAGNIASASTTAGQVNLTVTGSASFSVQKAGACSASIVGATLAVTGEPFLGEGILAGGLLALGLSGLLIALRRRPRPA
jgi:hypothetical protein